ncbi:MAG: hypothetical protein K0S32_1382 [Bacteroidetes bacterium]|jgi:type IX secretion system PorP/SprF family membrane protein|nr:hypothetical protein [Bacteroidota bacterium]
MRKLIIVFCLGLAGVSSFAQQDALYSMYTQDKMLVNPAFAGSSNWAVGTIKYRSSLTGLGDKFSTQTVNFHAPIQAKHLGFGFKLVNDKRAILNNFNFGIVASYHLNFFGGKLSAGLEGGIFNRRINYDKLVLSARNDQAIPLQATSSTVPDFSFGFHYQKRQFYVGYSLYHLLKSKFDKKEIDNPLSHLYKNNYILIGNVFDVSKEWSVEPSLLLKWQPQSTTQLDINFTACYKDKISGGIQFRTKNAFLVMVKYNITENFKIAYSYDYPLTKFSQISNGAHEIVVSYGVKLAPPPTKKEIHPRYYF